MAAANLPRSTGREVQGAFNIGTGVETSVNDLFARLARSAGFDGPPGHGPARPGEQRRSCLDPARAARELGWRPSVSLDDGLARTFEFFKKEAATMIDEELRAILACPACKGDLSFEETRIICPACRKAYPIRDGIPVMLISEAEPWAPTEVTAVILAGGQGTRLRPLTLRRPKPIVPLLNVPFLAYQLALLRAHGITDVVLSCSYLVDDVRPTMGDGARLGVRLRYAVEDEPLGTAGGVRNAVDLARRARVRAQRRHPHRCRPLRDARASTRRAARARRSTSRACADPTRRTAWWSCGRGRPHPALPREAGPAAESRPTPSTPGIYLIDARAARRASRPAARCPSSASSSPRSSRDRVPFFGWVAEHYWLDIGSPAAYRAGRSSTSSPGASRTPLAPAGRGTAAALGGTGRARWRPTRA